MIATDTIRSFVERLERDAAKADQSARLGVFDLAAGRWIVEPDRTDPPERDFGNQGWVVRIRQSDTLVDRADLLVELAGLVQDAVIDETGRSWPDVDRGGRTAHLQPFEVHGDIYWTHKGELVCPVGELP